MGGLTPTEENLDEWAIVWLQTPQGQLSWHVPRELAEEMLTRNDAWEYDGHSQIEKNDRLAEWIIEDCWR